MLFQYQLEKPINEEYEEEDDDEDYPSSKKLEEVEEDPIEGKFFIPESFPQNLFQQPELYKVMVRNGKIWIAA